MLFRSVGDMERVGDHCENIADLADAMMEEGVTFSDTAVSELTGMVKSTKDSYMNALKSLEFSDVTFAHETVREEDCVDDLEAELRASHINRLANNLCNARSGIRFLDTLTNLERISDHALNIAQVVLNDTRAEKQFHSEKFSAE